MKVSDDRELHSHLAASLLERRIDFVVGPIISHWHAVGADAFIYGMTTICRHKPAGIVIIAEHAKDGLLIEERDFWSHGVADLEFVFPDPFSHTGRRLPGKALDVVRRNLGIVFAVVKLGILPAGQSNRLYIASLLRPNTAFFRVLASGVLGGRYRPAFVLLDEGLATYMTGRVWDSLLRMHGQAQGLPPSASSPMNAGRVALNRLIARIASGVSTTAESIALSHTPIEDCRLFRLERGGLAVNPQVADWYRYVLAQRARRHGPLREEKDLAVVVTQPFSEYGQVSLAYELGLVSTLMRVLLECGFDVLLKPHPRESPGKYDAVLGRFGRDRVRLQHQSMPVEELLPALRPGCVIGYTGTTLPVANALYGVAAISIVDMLLQGTDDGFVRMHAAEFKRLTSRMCSCATSPDELTRVLAGIPRNVPLDHS